MKFKLFLSCFVIFIIQLYIVKASAYDNKFVHQMINGKAIQQSLSFQNYLNVLGFKDIYDSVNKREIWQWFYDGAQLEDETSCRSKFHFHDPTKSWDTAGLSNAAIDTYCRDYTHRSSLVWAQDTGNLWTWQKARQYYYDVLTNPEGNIREQNLAYTFRSLGQVMHLTSDSSVPAHVRNDIHIFPYTIPGIGIEIGDPTFESWAKDNYKNLNYTGIIIDQSIFNNAIAYPSAPVAISALWDLDKYTGSNPAITIEPVIGLAEYANANFFSEDTIFSDYDYPAWSSVEEYEEVIDTTTGKVRTYLRKTRDGERIEHLAAGKRFYKYLPSLLKSSGLILDQECYKDYAQKLIPRAVGYSAGLLDYFFRGVLEISAPDQYVYAITDGSKIYPYEYTDEKGITYHTQQQLFTRIRAKVINMTPKEKDVDGNVLSYENIGSGSLIAVARYKVIPDYSPDLANYPPDGTVMMNNILYKYSVSLPVTLTPEEIISLNTQPTEFTFDFTGNEIPAGITDLTLQVIFKGTLGNETDIAVAVGMKNLMEPTHQVLWNLTDMFSLYYGDAYHLYTSEQIKGDPSLKAQVDLDHDGVINEPGEPYIDPHPMTYEIGYMAEPEPVEPPFTVATVDNLPAGNHIRLIVLVDDELSPNYLRLTWSDPIDSDVDTHDFDFLGVINEEQDGVWLLPNPIIQFRHGLDGTTQIPIQQHFYTGILRCYPVAIDPVTGYTYCPYTEEEAIPADLTPYPVD